MPPPTAQAVGRAVTLRLRDGRQVHGTLQDAAPREYTLQLSSTGATRSFPRYEVSALVVHEWVQR